MNRIICGAVVLVLLPVGTDARVGGLYGSEFATQTMGTAGAGAAARADDASTCYTEYYNAWRTHLGLDKYAARMAISGTATANCLSII